MNAPARKSTNPPPSKEQQPSKPVLATLEDLLAIPEGERRHELIEGTIYPKESAAPHHGHIQRRLSAFVDPFDRSNRNNSFGGWWIVTEVDVYFDPKNTLRPDLSGWRRERLRRLPEKPPIHVRPDWVCEILSTNRSDDLVKKNRIYHRHQVPHYWIIDPVARSLYVWRWTPEGYLQVQTAERGEIVNAEPFEVLPFSLDAVFGDEPEDETDEKNETPTDPESKTE